MLRLIPLLLLFAACSTRPPSAPIPATQEHRLTISSIGRTDKGAITVSAILTNKSTQTLQISRHNPHYVRMGEFEASDVGSFLSSSLTCPVIEIQPGKSLKIDLILLGVWFLRTGDSCDLLTEYPPPGKYPLQMLIDTAVGTIVSDPIIYSYTRPIRPSGESIPETAEK